MATPKPTQCVYHDAFGRYFVVRERADGKCSWCGGLSPKGRVYTYGIEPESISCRVNWCEGQFCCGSCFRSYNS